MGLRNIGFHKRVNGNKNIKRIFKMTLYKAKKGNIGFYIQQDMIEDHAMMGYEIVKLEEVVVKDVKSEVEKNSGYEETRRKINE